MEPLIFPKALTAKVVEQVKPASVRREIPDGLMRGLYLVVYPSGKKGWAVRYRHKGRPRKLTLDPYPVLQLADARDRARDALLEAGRGQDPAGEKKIAKLVAKDSKIRDRDVFKNVLAEFLLRHAKKNRSAPETERLFAREVVPWWGERRIQDITKRDVIELLDRIVDRGRGTTANRTLSAIRRLFNWSLERDILTASPCTGVKPPAPEVSRDRILSDEEIRWLWFACDAIGEPFGAWTKLLLVTAQPKEEVGGLTFGELVLAEKSASWIIPAVRAKNRREHLVSLPRLAVDIIRSVTRISGKQGYVFTTTGATPLSGYSRAKRSLDRTMLQQAQSEAVIQGHDPADVNIPHWTFHDLRRTAASGMARLGQPVHVVEAVLNHKSGSIRGVAAVYNRYHYAEEKKRALHLWASFLLELTARSTPSLHENTTVLVGETAGRPG